jgi:hypothetical protein
MTCLAISVMKANDVNRVVLYRHYQNSRNHMISGWLVSILFENEFWYPSRWCISIDGINSFENMDFSITKINVSLKR